MLASMRRTLKRIFLIDVIFLKPGAESDREMSRSHSERYRPQLISRLINATRTHARPYDRIVGRCIIYRWCANCSTANKNKRENVSRSVRVARARLFSNFPRFNYYSREALRSNRVISFSHVSPSPSQQTRLIRSFLFPSRLFCLT